MTFLLFRTEAGYELREQESSRRPLTIDFGSNRIRHRVTAGGRELLAKAVGARAGLRVLDCTAGLGTDAFILASKGCHVTLIERSNTLWLMLDDALTRAEASSVPSVAEIARRMQLVRGDARYVLAHLDMAPDVITIDPMFPKRRKTAEVKGELQALQGLVGKDEDVGSLLGAACATACPRVVVKRPLTAPLIEGFEPTFSAKGKASRFDVYVRAS